jgi:hypothetical protein
MLITDVEIIEKTTPILFPIDTEIEDIEDPFLCPQCQKHGYCIERFYKEPKTNELIRLPKMESKSPQTKLESQTPISTMEISNIVNVRTDIQEASSNLGKKLQQAHDLFHQDEFEQASYIYLDIIETRNDITEAWRGICASFYFLAKYDEAVAVCVHPKTNLKSTFVDGFLKACEEKMVVGENQIKEFQTSMVTHFV